MRANRYFSPDDQIDRAHYAHITREAALFMGSVSEPVTTEGAALADLYATFITPPAPVTSWVVMSKLSMKALFGR